MPYIGKTPTVGNFQVCDAISVVNGQAAYTLQVGGANVAPESANHMLVSLNGILQKPGSSFTISGSTMTFASNLATGDVIDFVQILGNVLDLGQPSDDTVKTASIQANAVTAAKLNNDIISGLTALTSAPDDTDEFLISDAGTIKRIDASLVGGGSVELLYSTNAMSGSVFNIDNIFSTNHRVYKIFVDKAYASNDAEFQFNFRSGGSSGSIQNASNYRFTGVRQERHSSGGASVAIANTEWGITYGRFGQTMESGNASFSMQLDMTIWNPIDTSPTHFRAISNSYDDGASYIVGYDNSGVYQDNASITGIAFNASSGSWSSGAVRVYGYKES
mgnify:CR=1 FL=1